MATNLKGTERRRATRLPRQAARQAQGPSEDRVRVLAYQLYEQRQADGISGDATSDWIEAERLLASGEN